MTDKTEPADVRHTTPHLPGTHIHMPDGSLVTIRPDPVEELYAAMREASRAEKPLTADELIRFAEEAGPAEPVAGAEIQTPVEAPVEEPVKPARARSTAKEA